MSITSALYSATSGLMAQSKALSSISGNIANSSTTGFKGTNTSFESYINRSSSVDTQTGGVTAYTYRSISQQGQIEATSVTTNLALNGEGFFVVTDGKTGSTSAFTRNGSFSADANGYLVNSEGYYLEGWAMNESGQIAASNKGSVDSLSRVNIGDIKGTPKATSAVGVDGNLPSEATTGSSFTSDISLFDSLGSSHSVTLTWTKTGSNSWEVNAANPTSSSDSSTETGTITGFPISVAFNSDGSLASTTPSPPSFTVSGWTSGASDSTVTLDLGTAGGTDGLTQYNSGETSPALSVEATQDGHKAGTLTGTTIDENGVMRATFDNGETRAIYQIPVATFANADGLDSVTGTTFTQTTASGQYQLRTAGDGKAGEMTSSALESSTVELTTEFSRMIVAQQAYSAASKVVTTTQDMFDTLMSMKR